MHNSRGRSSYSTSAKVAIRLCITPRVSLTLASSASSWSTWSWATWKSSCKCVNSNPFQRMPPAMSLIKYVRQSATYTSTKSFTVISSSRTCCLVNATLVVLPSLLTLALQSKSLHQKTSKKISLSWVRLGILPRKSSNENHMAQPLTYFHSAAFCM